MSAAAGSVPGSPARMVPGGTDPGAATVLVFGSINVDVTLLVDELPAPGETVLSTQVIRLPGGKGANQAAAVARAGVRPIMIGAVGADGDGAAMRAELVADGVDVAGVRELTGVPTGFATVMASRSGENAIVVAPGANAAMTGLAATDRSLISSARVLLAQLECPLPGVTAALVHASSAGVTTVLNAAPTGRLPDSIWASVDVLIVNETEAAALLGVADIGADPAAAAAALTEFVGRVVITLGGAGALSARRGEPTMSVPALPVQVVDTTGAGDAFCGAFAAATARGLDQLAAVAQGMSSAAYTVQHRGARPPRPT